MVTLLTNFVPPYLIRQFAALERRVGELRIIVSTRMEPNRPWTFQGEGLPVHVQRTVTLPQIWRHPGAFAEVTSLHFPLDTFALLRRDRPDVIVTTEFGFRTLQSVLYRAFRRETAVVAWAPVSELSEQSRGRVRERLRRWLLGRVDAVIVTSESGARYIRHLGFLDDAIFRVPHTTDGDAFASPARARGANPVQNRLLLYVGQLVERKAVSAFLTALAGWAEANPAQSIEFWVVGDGPLRRALESRYVPRNLEVRFWGNIAYSELPDYYARAGIFVMPTLVDEWGVVVNEAMAAGLPVLGSRNSQAVEEMVTDGKTGWTFRPERPDEISSAIGRVFATPDDELRRMRDWCRERADDFTPEVAADRMLAAIEYAASARGGPSGCPLCGERATVLLTLPHTRMWKCAAGDCGLRFAWPQASESGVRAAYHSLYYPGDEGTGAPPCEGTPDDIHRDLIRHLTAYGLSTKSARLLDYGCGRGALAGIAQQLGMQVAGIEPDPTARASASERFGLPVFPDLAQLRRAEPDARFDAIVLWQVIEHLREPWMDLASLRDLLASAGCLVVATPNANCPKARLQRARWENFANPTHFYYFGEESLVRLARNCGFEVVDRIDLPAVYPHHGRVRRHAQRWLRRLGLGGDLVFLFRSAI